MNEDLREALQLSESILDSLKEHVAVIDRNGDIIAVNNAWQQFAQENCADPTTQLGVGKNYFDVCQQDSGLLKTAVITLGRRATSPDIPVGSGLARRSALMVGF